MGMPVNANAYDEATDQDIEWLKKHTDSGFYQDEVIKKMELAKKYYREVILPSLHDEEWSC
jgi:hypothetical protein